MAHPLRVGVLRHTVFKPSERFIPDQVRATPDVEATIIARDPVIAPVDGVRAIRMPIGGRTEAARYVVLGRDQPLRRALAEQRIELLHAHFGVEGMYSREAAQSARIPHVVTLHGFDVSYSSAALLRARTASWARYAVLRRRFLASGSLLVCVSEHVRRLALELGAPPDRTAVLPTGVDTRVLTSTPPTTEPRIVHVARLVEKKGTAYLLDAVRLVRSRIPDVRLDIYGDGPLRRTIEAQVEANDLGQSVHLHGVRGHEAILEAMRQAAVVAVPSVTARSGDTEGLPQVVLEAGALARPVVGTDHAGIGEAVLNERTGLLVPERDVPALAESLAAVLEDQSLGAGMGSAARRRVEADFDVHRQAARLRDLYAAEIKGR